MEKMNALENRTKLFVPAATVFIASFCVMVLEISAGRLIARYLGVSLYTWTSVIAVILAGVSVGGYAGGRVADRFHSRKSLSILFLLAAIGCVLAPGLNYQLEYGLIFLANNWGLRILVHVALVFFLPSVFLGMVSPIVAKDALESDSRIGKTIGNIYAWGAAGSIAGTLITGFFLISAMGTVSVILMVAGILAVMALLYGFSARSLFGRNNLLRIVFFPFFLSILILSFWIGIGRANIMSSPASGLINTLYAKDSQYGYVKIESEKAFPSLRYLVIDALVHNKVSMDKPFDMRAQPYSYMRLYSTLTDYFILEKRAPAFLFLGGGGYVMPRYLQNKYPGSHIDVTEVDSEVTTVAMRYLGLPGKNNFFIHHLDARIYADELLFLKKQGTSGPVFDFIYGDTFNAYSVPYQLITFEFNEKLSQLLSPQGIYILNLIDELSSGKFLEATVNTLKKTFSYVYVISAEKGAKADSYSTFLVIASKRSLAIEGFMQATTDGAYLEDFPVRKKENGERRVILTDDYSPVEDMLLPVYAVGGKANLCNELLERGDNALAAKDYDLALKYYRDVVDINPNDAQAHNSLGIVLLLKGNAQEAKYEFEQAAQLNPELAESLKKLNLLIEK